MIFTLSYVAYCAAYEITIQILQKQLCLLKDNYNLSADTIALVLSKSSVFFYFSSIYFISDYSKQ